MKKLIENLFELQTLESGKPPAAKAAKCIAALRTEIPAQILAHYDRLLARGKKGVAVIKGQVCSACHMQVPRNTVLTLMNNVDIQICGNCGRYLCLPEHVSPVQAPPPAPPAKARKSRAKKPALAPAT
jgi:predicted  nucleic acid-binding Zn-ribbon protein